MAAIPLKRYNLEGPQVEPGAGYWTYYGKRIEVVNVQSLEDRTIPEFSTDEGKIESDLIELGHLADLRSTQDAIAGEFTGPDGVLRDRKGPSVFLSLRPHPIGSVIDLDPSLQTPTTCIEDQCEPREALVRTGEQLARLFENETPGLLHRHALNCLLFGRPVSPPRQARIWMALDVTIYSALLGAWHFKWANRVGRTASPDFSRSYIERPYTYEARRAKQQNDSPRFDVLYDYPVEDDGSGSQGNRLCPSGFPSPGTPRHPAYPSGHSTYSAAASELLAKFFPPARGELEKLADNIGTARLWAGVHWRQDHDAGAQLGKVIAQKVWDQLQEDPIMPLVGMRPVDPCDESLRPPSFGALNRVETTRRRGSADPDQDIIPKPDPKLRPFALSANSGAVAADYPERETDIRPEE